MTQTAQIMTPARQTAIRGMAQGKRWTLGGPVAQHWLAVRHPTAEHYVVEAAWPVEEAMGDDPGSFLCACPFAGTSHQHVGMAFPTADAAIEAAEAAGVAMAARRPVRLTGGLRMTAPSGPVPAAVRS